MCRYYKFGFCKYLKRCQFLHIKEICENNYCDVRTCSQRHPRICSYYRDYNRCKFGEWCNFKHVNKSKNSNTEIIKKIKDLEKLIVEKDALITSLVDRIKSIEEKLSIDDQTVKDIPENLAGDKEERKETVDTFRCEVCEFESNSMKGLHIHKKKKHAKKYNCDLCGQVFENETAGKLHRKTHSFESTFVNTKWEKQSCKNCDFQCNSVYTMEVHIGKCYPNNLECGFCDEKFIDLVSLELHLRTCEVYECSECYIKIRNISEIKRHAVEDHEDCDVIHHLKINLENLSEVIYKSYHLKDL